MDQSLFACYQPHSKPHTYHTYYYQIWFPFQRQSSSNQLTRGNSLLEEVLEADAQLVVMVGRHFGAIDDGLEEDESYLQGSLVDSCTDAALQHHLQDLDIGRFLRQRHSQLLRLLVDVLNGHLYWR